MRGLCILILCLMLPLPDLVLIFAVYATSTMYLVEMTME